jgi:hypothetical protein
MIANKTMSLLLRIWSISCFVFGFMKNIHRVLRLFVYLIHFSMNFLCFVFFFFTLILFRFKHLFLVSFLVQIFYGLVEPMLRVNLDRWTSSQLVTLFLADHFSCWWIFGVRVFFCKHTLRPTLTILFFK